MLLTKQALVLYVIATLTFFAGIFALSQFRYFGILNGIVSDGFLAFIPSIGAIFAMLRWVWSWALDHRSFKMIFSLLLCLQIFLCFTIFFIDKNKWGYAIWIWLFTFCDGGMFVLLPNAIKKKFGHKATAMYGFFGSFTAMCSIINLIAYNWLKYTLKSYNEFYIANGILSVIALLLLLFVYSEEPYTPKCFRTILLNEQPDQVP